ncbi:cadherin EGF LAG seven-pass G-type receptor 2-like [Phthorimaea operculella]|nr:cadherin EGF LAG seven-pass G-type receptor 2-like [Phthorimaea operculella]
MFVMWNPLPSHSITGVHDKDVLRKLEYAENFKLSGEANNLNLELVSDVPPDVIFSKQVLVFSVLAEKPLTVGAHAAVSIAFPRDLTETAIMQFAQNTYIGSIENNNLVLDSIVLENGYENGTEFSLSGEYQSYFAIQSSGNVINITTQNPLPQEILENNEFIILEIEANRQRAVSIPASIVIDIKKEEIIPLAFSNAYYKSVLANGSLENVTISLAEGYDETVTFELQGDNAIWFLLENVGNNVQLTLNTSMGDIPAEIIQNNDYFIFSIIANKPDANSARAAIFVHLPKETTETSMVRFSQASYVGRIENGTLYAPVISLAGELEPISFNITGEFSSFFEVSQTTPTNVEIRLRDGSLPANIVELPFIILDIEAYYPEAISGQTTVILEVVTEPGIVTPVFEQAYYTGEFSMLGGLTFDQSIRLSQGFDENVLFTLAGDDAQWFELSDTTENNFTLILKNSELGQVTDRSHLVFSVVASKNNSVAGSSAVVVSLLDYTTTSSIRFAQNLYRGSIENNTLTLGSIVMEEGYSDDLNISFTGDYMEYLELSHEGGIFTLQILPQMPDSVINENKVLVFTLQAKNGNSRTHTTIVLDIVKAEPIRLSFEEVYYVGSYSVNDGFIFDPQITLSEGYDETVLFSLEGDDSQWFGIIENQYPISLTQINPIPNDVIANNKHLIFAILAENPGNMTTRSTIVITLSNDSDMTILRFEQTAYLGTLESNTISLDTILLSDGYNQNVTFSLQGDLREYFTVSNDGASVTVSLSSSIPESQLPSNGIIILELQASAPNAFSAFSTIFFTIESENTAVEHLAFSNNYYTGHYTEADGLVFNDVIELMEAYNETVQFTLEGESSQYFGLERTTGNSVTLNLTSPIPSAVALNNHHLIFTIKAEKTGTVAGKATIIIALFDGFSEDTKILGFERVTYMGTLENNTLNFEEIILSNGHSDNVTFRLFGDLESYFGIESNGSTVTLALDSSIPEQSLPENGIIVLELEASATGFMSAHAAIIITVVREEMNASFELLIFSEAYYTGHYAETAGLAFTDEIRLTEGFDTNVTFALEGESSQYFDAVVASDSVSLKLILPIPSSVVMNNRQLIFTIRAEKPDAISARATIVISLLDDFNDTITILGFDKINYLGSLEQSTLNLDPITLTEGYSDNVTFSLQGALNNYFAINSEGPIVTITLNNTIPVESMPENKIIILELLASAPDSLSAHATIVIEIIQEENPMLEQLFFSSAYYTGSYMESEGFTFTDNITLSEGYDSNVTFKLEGDDSQYFEVDVSTENSVSLRQISSIPSAVAASRHQFIFSIIANKSDAIPARAAIVIALYDDLINNNTTILGFERINYLGSLEQNTLNLDPITLSEGYSDNVTFSLQGALNNYFAINSEGPIVTITLNNTVPVESMPENKIIILELLASAPDSLSAHATIVIEIIQEEKPMLEQLIFSSAYYTGSYTESEGFTLTDNITLSGGYDSNVTFKLEGDDSQYFEVDVLTENSVSLRLISSIPSAVAASRHQFIFSIIANKSDAIPARAAIVIALYDDLINNNTTILGFEKINYLGSLEQNTLNLDSITLSEGYSDNVTFSLQGALNNYFAFNSEGPIVTITLNTTITVESMPENKIIILELLASAPDSLSAHATIVIEIIQEETPMLEQLIFSSAYYTGSYTESEGFTFTDNITLSDGYDSNVTFKLEGDDSQYFEVDVLTENSLSLRLVSSIPSAVAANRHQFIFTIIANKSDAIPARATIIIALYDELNETRPVLGFNRISYVGSIEGDVAKIDLIFVSEGYSNDVNFTLYGELQNYFTLIRSDNSVNVSLISPIPQEMVPSNRIIVLEIQASAPDTVSAHATIVFEVVQEDVGEMIFNEPFYTGQYNVTDGLTFGSIISLSQGYDDTVQFTLDGDDAEWFQLSGSGNSVSIVLASAIPEDVLQSKRKLIFVILAQKPGTFTRATIIISLVNDAVVSESSFGKILYEGIVQSGQVFHEAITLTGYNGTDVALLGENAALFSATHSEGTVVIQGRGNVTLSPDVSYVALQLQAGAASAVLVLDVEHSDNPDLPSVSFNASSYVLNTNVNHVGPIGLVFASADNDEAVAYSLRTDDPYLLQRLAVSQYGEIVLWARMNSGRLSVSHYGKLALWASIDSAVHNFDVIAKTVFSKVSASVPRLSLCHYGELVLRARIHSRVYNFNVIATTVFSKVSASVLRLSVSHYDELVLWASVDSGVYNFYVIATTIFSKVSASVPVHLTVEAVTIIDDNNYILPPLQILNRDEESPHMNLVPFNASTFEGCRLSLSNRWPADQNWLYVDENGVHTTAIDREHESIAFMAQSQIQVELVLNCDGDDEIDVTRAKRSADLEVTNQLEHLGPYDYGNSRWILTDSIIHNPRRSLVNLIVNDINDNAPVFIGKENEPIIVGYPVADLENRILPRALIEVKATDADVGENAAIVYWSTAEALAVSPTTGLVHVRDIAGLENDMTLTIQATDRNGQEQGLTGSLDIIDILTNLSAAVGYEVKALRSTMISDTESSEVNSRKKREAQLSTGASIQLYVYGLIEREPVNVERLTEDINTSVIETLIVASTVSLEDHLEICPLLGRDTALFVSTIVLAVLLFLLIVAAAVWFFLKWRKENYQQFSDENSLASQDVPVSPAPVNVVKPELPTPRMNIEDLKKSERRLQEMLESPAPLQNSPPSTLERSKESKVNMPEPPLVFQSFDKLKSADDTDDEDEFGEIKKNRRKSVVTFNENVEKIIHVEDTPDDDPDIEVYRL